MKSHIILALSLSIGLSLSSCNTSKSVTRVHENEQIDLSGRWNDTDSKLVAQQMIEDALSRPWLGDYIKNSGKKTDCYCWIGQK